MQWSFCWNWCGAWPLKPQIKPSHIKPHGSIKQRLVLLTLRQCIAIWLHCQRNREIMRDRSIEELLKACPLWFDGLGLYFFINDDMRWNIFDISLVACFNALKFIEEWNTQNKQIEQGRGAKSQSWPVCSLLSGYFLRGWDHILLRHVLRGSC